MLEARNLSVSYGALRALSNVSCSVGDGEVVSVLGPNGAGRSSLMNSIAGLVRGSGEVSLDGEALSGLPAYRRARLGLGLVMERRHLFAQMSVAENLMMGTHSIQRGNRRVHDFDPALSVFPELERNLHKRAETLSGGQQQMVAIGRGLMGKPKILMIDEPFLGLSPGVSESVISAIEAMRRMGLGVIFIEQSVEIAMRLSDRMYLLQHGEQVFEGPPKLAREKGIIQSVYFGETPPQAPGSSGLEQGQESDRG